MESTRIHVDFGEYISSRDHSLLFNRNERDQHAIDSITGLREWIDKSDEELNRIIGNIQSIRALASSVTETLTKIEKIEEQAIESISKSRYDALESVIAISNDSRNELVGLTENSINLISEYVATVDEIKQAIETVFSDTEAAASEALLYRLESEAWALGQKDGEPVELEDQTYNNNAKYYALLSEKNNEEAQSMAKAAMDASIEAALSESEAKGYSERSDRNALATQRAYEETIKARTDAINAINEKYLTAINDIEESLLEALSAIDRTSYIDADGETPILRYFSPTDIDGGSPQNRIIDNSLDFDGGTPLSRIS